MSWMNNIKTGKRKKWSDIKFILLLYMIKMEGPIGRYRLKEMLNLSEREGLVRRMLFDLKQKGFIRTFKSGSELTWKGEVLLEEISKQYEILNINEMDLKAFGIGPQSFIIHLQGQKILEPIVKLRDIAVKAGATGAVLLTYEKGALTVPTVYFNLALEYPTIAEKILKKFNLSEEDIIIICFSNDRWRALEGCLAVTMFLFQLKVIKR